MRPDWREAVTAWMAEHKITKADIARQTGWNKSYVTNLLKGKVPNPGIETVDKILVAIGMPGRRLYFESPVDSDLNEWYAQIARLPAGSWERRAQLEALRKVADERNSPGNEK